MTKKREYELTQQIKNDNIHIFIYFLAGAAG